MNSVTTLKHKARRRQRLKEDDILSAQARMHEVSNLVHALWLAHDVRDGELDMGAALFGVQRLADSAIEYMESASTSHQRSVSASSTFGGVVGRLKVSDGENG